VTRLTIEGEGSGGDEWGAAEPSVEFEYDLNALEGGKGRSVGKTSTKAFSDQRLRRPKIIIKPSGKGDNRDISTV